MKTVILAGGLGSRLAEETVVFPKPMVEIGGWPMLCHIMHIYSAHGFRDFIVSGGYKCEVIKEYFWNFRLHASDVHVDLASGETSLSKNMVPDWRVTIVYTGDQTQTGGRIKVLEPMLRGGTVHGDQRRRGRQHRRRGPGRVPQVSWPAGDSDRGAPPARFGALVFEGNRVIEFSEKPQIGEGWINGSFMVLEPGVLDYIEGPESILEHKPMERLAVDGQLMAYRHGGFWHSMDTLREKRYLESLWESGTAPWKIWSRSVAARSGDDSLATPVSARPTAPTVRADRVRHQNCGKRDLR